MANIARRSLLALAALSIVMPAAAQDKGRFQMVTPSITCSTAYTQDVNRDFVINVMVVVIQSVMEGQNAPNAGVIAESLNRFSALGPTGDAGVSAIASTRRAWGAPPDDPAIVARARARAVEMLPGLGAACTANPDMPFLVVMQHVLHEAGYGSLP